MQFVIILALRIVGTACAVQVPMRRLELSFILIVLAWGVAAQAFGPYGIHDPILDQDKTCHRMLQGPLVTPREKAEQMYNILSKMRKIPENRMVEEQIREALIEKFLGFMSERKVIKMYIPCFPAKSPNHMVKTLGPVPDLAEEIALARIGKVVDEMAAIYPTQFDLASDGRIFADTWWATDAEIDTYQRELRKLIPSANIQLRDFDYYYPDLSPAAARDHIMALYAPTAEEVKASFKEPDRMSLYLAFTRFISTDTSPNDPALFTNGEPISGKAREKLFKARAIEDIRRSDALNKMLAEKLVKQQGYIRLSIREQSDTPDKIGVNLLAGDEGEFVASPWHSVIAVLKNGSYKAMKKVEAEIAGYEIVEKNGRPHHFIEK